jgi:DNA polymerase III epsilon subunit family exonuclease
MKSELFAFIDTETTGLNPDLHELIQIGGVVVHTKNTHDPESYEVIEEFEYKIKPLHIANANPTALKVNQYDPSQWTEALSLAEAMTLVAQKTEGAVMVAHNVAFDAAFVDKAFRLSEIENKMHYHKLDTVSMAYALLHNNDSVDRLSLHSLCQHFGIKQGIEHQALSDARETFELYKKLLSL